MNNSEFEPNIIAFLCNWCSYAGADLAGTSRIQYPPNVKIIRVMCSSRINPLFLVNALQQGADGVLVAGCHPGDCHYAEGNFYARRRFFLIKNLMEYVGIEPERIQMAWVSASEGARWAKMIQDVTSEIRQLGPMKQIPRREIP
ncbi:MAG: hydrogenase iron-sulfur subunit [Chloroflexota bacterium]